MALQGGHAAHVRSCDWVALGSARSLTGSHICKSCPWHLLLTRPLLCLVAIICRQTDRLPIRLVYRALISCVLQWPSSDQLIDSGQDAHRTVAISISFLAG